MKKVWVLIAWLAILPVIGQRVDLPGPIFKETPRRVPEGISFATLEQEIKVFGPGGSEYRVSKRQKDYAVEMSDIRETTFPLPRYDSDLTESQFRSKYGDVLPEMGPAVSPRYQYLENEIIRIEFDLQAGGMITGIWIQDSETNIIDKNDNGRGIQIDMGTHEECEPCKERWPDIEHRWYETPTQGGGWPGRENWPIMWAKDQSSFIATARMVDYWDPRSRSTEWIVDFKVDLDGSRLMITGEVYHDFLWRRRIEVVSSWAFFNEELHDSIPDLERWNDTWGRPFVNANPIDLNGIEFGGENRNDSKIILSWIINGGTGEGAIDPQRPEEAVSLMTGVRYWIDRHGYRGWIDPGEKASAVQYLDFEDWVEEEPPTPPDPEDPDKDYKYQQWGPVHQGRVDYGDRSIMTDTVTNLTAWNERLYFKIYYFDKVGIQVGETIELSIPAHGTYRHWAPNGAESILVKATKPFHRYTACYGDGPSNVHLILDY